MQFDTVIYNGTVVTADPAFQIIQSGVIGVKDGKIAYLQERADEEHLPSAKENLDVQGALITPGLVNTHTHLPMSLFRGLADDLPLHDWLNEHIFPAESKHLNPEAVRWGALLACCEMLLSGTTACCDGYFFEDDVASAVLESGMRGVLAQGVIDFPAPGAPIPEKNVEIAAEFAEKWKAKSSRIRSSIFCHSPYTCSEKTIINAKRAASDHNIFFQIHAAETKEEKENIQNRHGVSPVRFLDKLGVLDPNTLLAHAIWVDDHDIEIICKSGAGVSHAPESNMKLASGVAPIPKMIDAGAVIGLGSDGCASNNTLDLFKAMDVCAKLHKIIALDPTTMDARNVFEMATIGGAKSIGLGDVAGSIELNKSADIIVIDIRKPHLIPIYSPISHLVYAVKGSDVQHVFIDGRHVVKNRQIMTLDVEEIMERVSLISKGIDR